MNYISLFLAATALVSVNAVIVRKNPEVATPRPCGTTRPVNEAVPLCLQKGLPRCPDCDNEHRQLVEKLCNEAKELRSRHELFLASLNNLKGAKGELN
jgi:hypothetical protein